MQLSFDPRDRNAATAALAAILALHGPTLLGTVTDNMVRQLDGEPDAEAPADPAAAFAGGAAPDQVFGQPPALPPGAAPAASPTPPTPPAPASGAAPPAGGGGASPAPSAPTGTVELDKHGLPHDGRIHSSPPKKNADNTWRQKRGVDPALVASVTAELQRAMAAPAASPPAAPAASPPAAPAASPPAAPAVVPVAAGGAPADNMADALEQSRAHLGTGGEAPGATVPPAPPVGNDTGAAAPTASTEGAAAASDAPAAPATPPAAPAAAPVGLTFADLMRKITGLQATGGLTVEGTQQIAQSLGITGVRDLMHRSDLIPSFDALLPVVPAA